MDSFEVDAALQEALDRLTLLNQTGAVLASTLDAVEGLRRVCRVLVPALADWCVADVMDEAGRLERVCVTHHDPDTPVAGLTGVLPAVREDSAGPWARVLRGADALLLSPEEFAPESTPSDPLHAVNSALFRRMGGASGVVAPLRARRRILGALALGRGPERQPLGEEDLDLVEGLAHRAALYVDNARLHAEVQNIAERLQRSLLPTLPVVDGLRIAARYSPATATAQIGGDWYDSFVLPGGDTALIIGDVTGHDLQAAVTMSQIRNMLRGIACDRQEPPGHILRRLDLAIAALNPHQTATCVYALLKGPGPDGHYTLDWARAGHLPPLLVTAAGDTRYLEAAHGMVLGVDPEALRTSATSALPPGGTLLLYTDGLVERRGEPLDHSLTRLRQHAAALVGQSLDVLCDELMAGMAPHGSDDVALIALRLPV
ncbi:PP2C family protein-serine/threonine phosphatase [Streptomyces sp. LaPpAH-108]|uniref:PP2C family protein-serine/threonine phosphatase n=1 Tax=Streptomyces sp. LaPpAH-108 TaxID=1155714 RepID=UPI00036462CA|nr:GAF domain-containing SpoIIE family protein phosphatase [Streptomyces sp. LaPpAH-108]